jgi:hypothetical protein
MNFQEHLNSLTDEELIKTSDMVNQALDLSITNSDPEKLQEIFKAIGPTLKIFLEAETAKRAKDRWQ